MARNGYTFTRWTKAGMDRVYVKELTGFKNRPTKDIGHIDVLTGEITPAHGQHAGSVAAHLSSAGFASAEAVLVELRSA
jgi:hypothetical protein